MDTSTTSTTNALPAALRVSRATIYYQGDFGFNYRKVEVRDLVVTIDKWAQYQSAVHAVYTPKGARRQRRQVFDHRPTLVIVEGWGHELEPGSMFGPKAADGSSVSRYSSCDAEWNRSFRGKLAAYVSQSGAKVLADYHDHDSHARTF